MTKIERDLRTRREELSFKFIHQVDGRERALQFGGPHQRSFADGASCKDRIFDVTLRIFCMWDAFGALIKTALMFALLACF